MQQSTPITAALAAALAIAGCSSEFAPGPEASTGAHDGSTPTAPVMPQGTLTPIGADGATGTATTAPGNAASTAGENDGQPDLAAIPLAGPDAKTAKGARAILLPWARGIELREFDQSWKMMGDAAKAQISRDAFNAMFHPLRDITVAIPGGSMEGAAGSSYYTVPTTVTGTRADGSKAKLTGEVVLRRVNDVPGATPAQLAWHIEQVNLKPA